MSRSFAGGTAADVITLAPGNAPPDAGPVTIAALVKWTGGGSPTGFMVQGVNAGSSGAWGSLISGNLFMDGDFSAGYAGVVNNAWCWYVVTKASGSNLPRWHVKNVTAGSAWVHADGPGNVGDGSGPPASIRIGCPSGGDANVTWRGSMAALATWDTVLDDAAVEAACTLAAADLAAAAPVWGVLLDQASTATAVTDFTGGGGDQTALSGTAATAEVPPGWTNRLDAAAQTLFTSEAPATTNADNANSITLGTYFTPAADGWITHVRWYPPTTAQNGVKAAVMSSDGITTRSADVTFPDGIARPGWVEVALDSPLAVVSGGQYVAAVLTPRYYAASTGASSPWPVTNGDLSSFGGSPGRFEDDDPDGTVQLPDDTFNNGCYFVDVVFTATDPGGAPETVAVERRLAARWTIRAAVEKRLTARWNVRAAVERRLAARWNIRKAVARRLTARWLIETDEPLGGAAMARIRALSSTSVSREVGGVWDLLADVRDAWDRLRPDAPTVTITLPGGGQTTIEPEEYTYTSGVYLAQYILPSAGRYYATMETESSGSVSFTALVSAAASIDAYPTLIDLRGAGGDDSGYLGSTNFTDAEIQDALDAEQAAQARACRIPASYSTDLRQALMRRVARNLSMRRLPLAVLRGDAEAGDTVLPGNDPEVRRLERPYRKLPIG